jgi:N-dimethylarginine dimethylaminohydrolase
LKTTKLTKFSAYGGNNFQVRKNENEEVNTFHNEYKKLKSITLFIPGKEINNIKNPDRVQHLDKINYKKMRSEMKKIQNYFRKKKIEVIEIVRNQSPPLNLCFTRDLYWIGPKGIVQGRMGSEIRKAEEKLFLTTVALHELNFHCKLKPPSLFEGADALWLDTQNVLVGTKNRTNKSAFYELKKLFPEINFIEIILPKKVQHLLGMIQFIDKNKVLLRYKLAPTLLKKVLKKYHYNIINVDESYEVTHLQAMNVVTIKPNTIIMPADCPAMEKIYLKNKINIDSKFNIQELRKAGGGLACAIGILNRGD